MSILQQAVINEQKPQLSPTNRATFCTIRNGVAHALKHGPSYIMCYTSNWWLNVKRC